MAAAASNTMKQQMHVAIMPSPGIGHLIPLVELAKLLHIQHGFSVTFVVPTDGSPSVKPQQAILQTLPDAVSSIFLPPVKLHDLPHNTKIETRIILTLARSLPALRDSLKALQQNKSTRLVALVVDLFGVDAFDVARDFGILPFLFFPSTAMLLSFLYELPSLDDKISSQLTDLPQPIKLPGCVPVHARDLADPVQDKNNEVYERIVHLSRGLRLAAGIIINSFHDLEPGALSVFKNLNKPPVYPVGPLTRINSNGAVEGSECMQWLEQQPHGSVLFISFGSGGTLSYNQFNELAYGLEMSGQRFMWVIKSPPDERATNAAFFGGQSIKDPFSYLPEGFSERTKGIGVVVASWAPQIQVLGHGSTGGFISHCGWNSTLESIVHGVPIIAWPLYAEQKMNAVMLAEDLKVALRVEADSDGIVKRENIASYARRVIEGEDGKILKNNVEALKDAAAAAALSHGGSSKESLEEVVQIWKTHTN